MLAFHDTFIIIIAIPISLIACVYSVNSIKLSPIVKLSSNGQKIQGKIEMSRGGREYFSYLGIPYANPPQRFTKAELAVGTWEGVRNVSEFGSDCTQMSWTTGSASGSEDCLYLNLYSRNIQLSEDRDLTSVKLPVIVFIHGGGFHSGSGGQYSPEYLMDEDIIFVSFNYRLGALGFLNTGDSSVHGNVGLKDQTLAFRWVRRNVEAFGGDYNSITIFGGSAGAAAVSYHLISPMSQGLFQRAISGSGSVDCPWAFDSDPLYNAKNLATQLNCSADNTQEMIKCMKTVDAKEFVGKSFTPTDWSLDPIAPFVPSTENVKSTDVFLPDSPYNLLSQGKFNKDVPWLVGMTNNEGLALHSAAINNNETLLQKLSTEWNRLAPLTFSFQGLFPVTKLPEISQTIRNFYFPHSVEITKEGLENLYSDRNFFHGIRSTIMKQAANGGKVYSYIFDFKGIPSWLEDYYGFNTTGVSHGDDFAHYVKFYLEPGNPATAKDLPPNSTAERMSKKLVKLIVHFAKYGTPWDSWNGVRWPPVSKFEAKGTIPLNWFHINESPTLEKESESFKKRMEFWNHILLESSVSNSNASQESRTSVEL